MLFSSSSATPLDLDSALWRRPCLVPVKSSLAHFAGLAYGDGYPTWGEVRIVTSNEEFAKRLVCLVADIARDFHATTREYVRSGEISDKMQHNVVLNSTLVRRALFDDMMHPNYSAIHSIATESDLAADFQAGLSDAEGSLMMPHPIDSPHGRVFAVNNSDRRLLGITRLSLVNQLRLEPSSVRTRLASRKDRSHTVDGIQFVQRRNNYLIEILSGAKRKWLEKVGKLLWYPSKTEVAKFLLTTYDVQPF